MTQKKKTFTSIFKTHAGVVVVGKNTLSHFHYVFDFRTGRRRFSPRMGLTAFGLRLRPSVRGTLTFSRLKQIFFNHQLRIKNTKNFAIFNLLLFTETINPTAIFFSGHIRPLMLSHNTQHQETRKKLILDDENRIHLHRYAVTSFPREP